MKKTRIAILTVLAAVAFILTCSQTPDGGPSWVNFASMAALAYICYRLDRLGAFGME